MINLPGSNVFPAARKSECRYCVCVSIEKFLLFSFDILYSNRISDGVNNVNFIRVAVKTLGNVALIRKKKIIII